MSGSFPAKYVSIENQGRNYAGPPPPPPYRGDIPKQRSKRKRCGCGLCGRICCCCFCCLLTLIFILGCIFAAFYFFVKPHLPSYTIEDLNVTSFDIKDNKLNSEIAIVVKADNPNKDIGLNYGDNKITILYSDTELCSGQFTPFLQPGKNTTNVNVDLKGQVDFDHKMQEDLMQDNKEGNISLLIKVRVSVRLVIYDMHFRKVEVNVYCTIDIDHLQPKQKPKVSSKNCFPATLF